MFGGQIMLLPGQALRGFTVYKPTTRSTVAGREGLTGGFEEIGEIKAMLAEAKPEEKEKWRQLSHPITHKIIVPGRLDVAIKPGYTLDWACRKFYVQAIPKDVGGLGVWTVIYCDERPDIA